MSKTLIKNAVVYDGSGDRPYGADVLINGPVIEKIGARLVDWEAEIVEAGGKALAPGFINTHSHMEFAPFKTPDMFPSVSQGITTECLGQDGSSVCPLTDAIARELADNMAPLAGTLPYAYPWRSFADYMKKVEEAKPACRMVSLVGEGTIRMNVMGSDNRRPTPKELKRMQDILAQCMEEGAKGMSLGLIYPPGSYAETDELIAMAQVVADYDGLIMVHMRNEKERLLESMDEMLEVIKATGVRLQISHFKALGHDNWTKVDEGIAKLENMAAFGYEVNCDQYPWSAACTGLKVCCPHWAFEGGEQGFQARLKDLEQYAKILAETEREINVRGGGKSIMLAAVATEEYQWMAGQTMDVISEKLGMEVAPAVLHILQHEGPSVIAIYFSISDEKVVDIMKTPYQVVCTDGIAGTHPHPRMYSTYHRFLGHYVRELGVMSLEKAVHKITMEPARRLRLWDRGLIREGMSADLVLFDPDMIKEGNSYVEPDAPSVGILKVWVLGEVKFEGQ
ncbi:MAG: D-aminoacylase [Lachnospiraceae bacterium]|nr:D-aminoacylase [Lachnospiraceae bacterium]